MTGYESSPHYDIEDYNEHIPVLFHESIEALNVRPDGLYVDLTLGRGGHSEAIAEKLDGGRLFCFDKDQDAIDAASKRLSRFEHLITFIRSDFREVSEQLEQREIYKADGILMDLGVSSPQLDNVERGFSYTKEAPLDMRMDRQSSLTAADIVNNWSYEDIKRILYEYGEERYAPRIASRIVSERPIYTTTELTEIIKEAMPAKALREKQHPAKRTFQAIRIAVNDELGALEEALEAAERILSPSGRLAVITFHSLEDKIVKRFISSKAKSCECPPDFPVCICGKKASLRPITRRPILPSEEEITSNPRSRSAKLRVAEKIE